MMPVPVHRIRRVVCLVAAAGVLCAGLGVWYSTVLRAAGAISLTSFGTAYEQDFDSLVSTGTSSLLPDGWAFSETGTNANATYTAGTGLSNAGDTYSFGASGASDRALGGLLSGSLVPTFGANFTNNTGQTVRSLEVSYVGEQWRLGALGRLDRLDFQYSLNATSLTTGTWVNVDALDFVAPVTTGSTGPLNGNLAANRVSIAGAVSGVSIPNGSTFWIRWADFNASSADDGLAVDDFAITPLQSSNPSGTGAASPAAVYPGETTRLTVSVTPGANPVSSGIEVRADLSAIGGSSTQDLFDDGTDGDVTAGDLVFSYAATLALSTAPGLLSLPATITDAEDRSATALIPLGVRAPASTTLVISQVYGGGGNSGAVYTHDFIEIFNLGATPVSVSGWSVQYASATGSSWQVTTLSGTILPGRYYLVREATNGGGTTPLPPADASGAIAMSATSGKVALVPTDTALTGACPIAGFIDFVGYGSANCSETSPTPGLSNTTAAMRKSDGALDTNDNSFDFDVVEPLPRNSAGLAPTGTGSADPAVVFAGDTVLFEVAVTPGTHPPSTDISVSADLSSIGGAASQVLLDDGTLGDLMPGDGVYSFAALVPAGTPEAMTSIPFTVADGESRSTNGTIRLAVAPAPTPIHGIQGAGPTSPKAGHFVSTLGVVTARRYNGFFIQTPDGDVDAYASTSEGVFVYTGGAPPAAGAVGAYVLVAGTVQEFMPDSASPSTTEIAGGPAVTALADSYAVPVPFTLTPADTPAGGTFDGLERLEGMRVRVPALRVVAPTDGSVSEVNASATSNGVFYGVIEGVARPMREPGIDVLDSLPDGAPCCVPRFDGNTERLRVDSDGQIGAPLFDVPAGTLLSAVIGPLDFGFRTWTILPDPGSLVPPLVVPEAAPVPAPDENEFTVASFNMQRFFDDANDPAIGEPVLTAAAFERRLAKASLAIRTVMRTPDILGVQEVENLPTLGTLALRLNADAVAAGAPNPGYVAYLVEGNDVGGIDVGFLVKSARVNDVDVNQEGKDATYIYVDPDTGTPIEALLNDRPPLILEASVHGPGISQPVTVIVNHLRSLSAIDDPDDGPRVRAKRAAQAEFLAGLIQARQAANPTGRIISVGDYNAYQFNDGYVDVIGTIKGMPTVADYVVKASPDLVNPDLTDLVDLLPESGRYSYSFDGSAQVLDHIIVNDAALQRLSRFHYARSNADFPETYRNDASRPERLSDHDMPVAYFVFWEAPLVTLNGENPMTVELGSTFVDPGATATDADLGALPVTTTGTVDTSTLGAYTLTYSATNGYLTTTVTRTVNVVDTTPPLLSAVTPSLSALWPPNHKMVAVSLSYTATDLSGAPACGLDVTSNEPINGTGDGDTSPDWAIAGATSVQLRAERVGTGSGRVYTITVTCADSSGNRSTSSASVAVPKSQGK